jgi:benzoate/toluate 1,2-dioxygenase beta subunit
MSHVVGNIVLEPMDDLHAGGMRPAADVKVRSTALIVEFRRNEQRVFAGTARHWLRSVDGAWKIAMKRIDLINCDAPMEVVQLFL